MKVEMLEQDVYDWMKVSHELSLLNICYGDSVAVFWFDCAIQGRAHNGSRIVFVELRSKRMLMVVS